MRLQPVNFREHWDRIKPGVEEALKYQHEGLRAEDIYCELKLRSAVLMVCEDGFLILKDCQHDNDKDLLIWLAHSWSKEPVIEKYSEEVDQIARDAGCCGIQIVSTRRGYERALPEGWTQMCVRYRKSLEPNIERRDP